MIASINKIINFSNVDGPHNRMAIFFQECNFNCLFCHNPETINKCFNCGDCVKTCPVNALSVKDGKVVWNNDICVNCDTCIKTCKHNASPKISYMSVEDVLKRVIRVKPYIKGITCSGGECTLHHEFMLELFKEVKKMGLTCLIDSNGTLDFSKHQDLLDVCDGVMLDVKAFDKAWHQKLCSYDNEIVIKNLKYLLKVNKLYEVRTIIFPNKDKENSETVTNVANIIKDKCFYKIIKYRPYGVRNENLDYLGHNETPSEYAEEFVKLAHEKGAIKAYSV